MQILKKYPLIPALFFILFAWSILHFITPYKPALKAQIAMDASPTIWQHEDSLNHEWQIKITEKYIHFRDNLNGVWQLYTYHSFEQPILAYEGASTTRKSHIKVFILPQKKGRKHEAVILQESKTFYGLLTATSNENKRKEKNNN